MNAEPGPLETVLGHVNDVRARGLIGEYAIGGAMAFVYWAEPFETKDLDIFAILPTNDSGLVDLSAIWQHLTTGGALTEGQFIRVGRLLLDFVPANDALDEEAIAQAVSIRVGAQATRVFTPEHAVAIALRTWRGKDREHIDRLIRTGRRPIDRARLDEILARHALVERWRRFKEMYDVDLG